MKFVSLIPFLNFPLEERHFGLIFHLSRILRVQATPSNEYVCFSMVILPSFCPLHLFRRCFASVC